MSAFQNGYPVHAWRKHLGEGMIYTACSKIVPERRATTDCLEVTCREQGCVARSQRQHKERQEIARINW